MTEAVRGLTDDEPLEMLFVFDFEKRRFTLLFSSMFQSSRASTL